MYVQGLGYLVARVCTNRAVIAAAAFMAGAISAHTVFQVETLARLGASWVGWAIGSGN